MKCPNCKKEMEKTAVVDLRIIAGRYDIYYKCKCISKKTGLKTEVIKSIEV